MTQSAQQGETFRILNDEIFKKKSEKEQKNNNNRFETNDVIIDKGISDTASLPRLPPSSCRQLSTIGYYLDGLYLVANPDTSKIETVYCDFGTTLSETLYGNVDVKLKSVHFFVQRSADFTLNNAVIPFDIERLNVGGAMDLASGVFTAPVDGIYHFEFSGMKDANAVELYIYLRVNGVSIGNVGYATPLTYFLSLSGINASLRLKTGDQVTLYKTSGSLNDNLPFSHFSGWLVEEDIPLLG